MELSKVAQLAREEADAAEREEEEAAEAEAEPTSPEPEPEPEPEPTAAKRPTDKQIEAKMTAAGKSAQRYATQFAEMIGADEDTLSPCPCCDVPGFFFVNRGPLDPEREQAVRAAMGEADVRDLEPAKGVVECEMCKGRGQLRRPTRVLDQVVAVCPTCNGFGWHGEQQQTTFAPPPQGAYQVQQSNGPAAEWTPPPPPGVNAYT